VPTQPLDYEARVDKPRGWLYTRVPLPILVLIAIGPVAIFSRAGRAIPGERWYWDELLMPATGYLTAIALALLSWSHSSLRRRIGLVVIIILSIAGFVCVFLRDVTHW
jgi:hypothetical protein